MAEGAWSRTAHIVAMIANVNRNAKRRPSPFEPDDFNPFAASRKRQREKPMPLRDMRKYFRPT